MTSQYSKVARKALIIGNHPIREFITAQFASKGYKQTFIDAPEGRALAEGWNDIVVLHESSRDYSSGIDAQSIATLSIIHKAIGAFPAVRPVVHLLLDSQETLMLLNTREYRDDWHSSFELNAFTVEDVWVKNILCNPERPGLDYRPITFECDRTVHLVVLGTGSIATALVENASLVAHFPNYVRNHALRTRITVVDDRIEEWSRRFIGRHKTLMDNSFYRTVDVRFRRCDLHRPMYEGSREDFVDVEWEFVHGSIHDIVVQDKIRGWASDDAKVLSVAVCYDNDDENLSQAILLSDTLCRSGIPVYVRQRSSVLSDVISGSPRMKNFCFFGMDDAGYDVSLPLLKMAKRVKSVYDYCYNHNIESSDGTSISSPSFIDDKIADEQWLQEKRAVKRYSNVCNAMTLSSKMRSLGHDSGDRAVFYAITREEIELIAKVEHNRWNVEELLLGYRPCDDEEQAEILADISKKAEYKDKLVHYDLRAYDDLRADETGRNVNTYDLCLSASIPLIVYDKEGCRV